MHPTLLNHKPRELCISSSKISQPKRINNEVHRFLHTLNRSIKVDLSAPFPLNYNHALFLCNFLYFVKLCSWQSNCCVVALLQRVMKLTLGWNCKSCWLWALQQTQRMLHGWRDGCVTCIITKTQRTLIFPFTIYTCCKKKKGMFM